MAMAEQCAQRNGATTWYDKCLTAYRAHLCTSWMTLVYGDVDMKNWNVEPSAWLSGGHSATKQLEYLRTVVYA
jgi:hypothetical protein